MFEKIIKSQFKTGTHIGKDGLDAESWLPGGDALLFNILTERSFIGIYVAQSGRFQFVNPVLTRFTGYSERELIGKKADILVHPEDRKTVRKAARIRLKGGQTMESYEFRIITKEGSVKWVRETVIPIFYGGKPAAMGNSINITSRKEAEERLRESEVLYRTIFETTGTAMMMVEEDMTISLINSEFEKLSGFTKEEVESKKKWHEFSANGPQSDAFRRIQRGSPSRYEFFFLNKQGRTKDVFLTMSLIPGTTKRIASILDMTELRLAEEAIQKRKQELKVKAQELEELNATLKILLRRREEDKNELEEKILTNIQKLVMPYLEKLKKSRLDNKSMAHVSTLESNLKDIASPFVHKLSSRYLSLTPKELQVAYLIKEGKSTKEIAEIMNVGPGAIDLHRNHVRFKLGLVNKKVNLRSYLLSLE
jgi:PAS domain S-box-containing protein